MKPTEAEARRKVSRLNGSAPSLNRQVPQPRNSAHDCTVGSDLELAIAGATDRWRAPLPLKTPAKTSPGSPCLPHWAASVGSRGGGRRVS
jgi:hypothetical protein